MVEQENTVPINIIRERELSVVVLLYAFIELRSTAAVTVCRGPRFVEHIGTRYKVPGIAGTTRYMTKAIIPTVHTRCLVSYIYQYEKTRVWVSILEKCRTPEIRG